MGQRVGRATERPAAPEGLVTVPQAARGPIGGSGRKRRGLLRRVRPAVSARSSRENQTHARGLAGILKVGAGGSF
jgi:hypothetical protein